MLFCKFKQFLLSAMCVVACTITSGCSTVSSWFEGDPAKIIYTIKTDATVNPNIDKEATPVTIMLLQLNSPEIFLKSRFIDMYTSTETVLNSTLVNSTTIESILPNTTMTKDTLLKGPTTHVAVLVGFSQFDDKNSKVMLPIENNDKDIELELNITGLHVELKKKE